LLTAHGDAWLLLPLLSGVTRRSELVLQRALSAYLGRYRGQTRIHTESDLRVFLH